MDVVHVGEVTRESTCRPPCGDGCVRPPVPKAKLWLEQAGREHRASARGTGGDSGVWKGASKGGNAPITGPFPPPGGHKGNVMERRGENGKMQVGPTTNSTTRLPVRPASSCSNKSSAFGTLGLADTGSHGGATKLNASFSPFPPYRPAGGSGPLRSCPHPGNPSDGGPGYARRVTPLS